jgi:hypothetical protein
MVKATLLILRIPCRVLRIRVETLGVALHHTSCLCLSDGSLVSRKELIRSDAHMHQRYYSYAIAFRASCEEKLNTEPLISFQLWPLYLAFFVSDQQRSAYWSAFLICLSCNIHSCSLYTIPLRLRKGRHVLGTEDPGGSRS